MAEYELVGRGLLFPLYLLTHTNDNCFAICGRYSGRLNQDILQYANWLLGVEHLL